MNGMSRDNEFQPLCGKSVYAKKYALRTCLLLRKGFSCTKIYKKKNIIYAQTEVYKFLPSWVFLESF